MTARDPIGFDAPDTNLHGYILGDPINAIDPSGNSGLAADALPAMSLNFGLAGIRSITAAQVIRSAAIPILGFLSWEAYTHFTKGGKQYPSNYVLEEAKAEAQSTGRSICDILAAKLGSAILTNASTKYIRDIRQAQKFAGCRGSTYSDSSKPE